jgi:hypothetical protein
MGPFRVLVERQRADPIAAEFLCVPIESAPFQPIMMERLRLLNSLVRAASNVSANAVRSLHSRRLGRTSAISDLPRRADICTNAGFRRYGPDAQCYAGLSCLISVDRVRGPVAGVA